MAYPCTRPSPPPPPPPYLGLLEVLEEAELLGHEQQQRPAAPLFPTSRAPHTVDVLLGVVRGVVLDDPVNSWGWGGGRGEGGAVACEEAVARGGAVECEEAVSCVEAVAREHVSNEKVGRDSAVSEGQF